MEAPSRATKPGFETFSSREVVLNGLIAAKTERTLTVKTLTETLTVERGEVAGLRESTLSLMPEGLLEALSAGEKPHCLPDAPEPGAAAAGSQIQLELIRKQGGKF